MNNRVDRNVGFFLAGAVLGGAAIALTTPFTGRRARRQIEKQIHRGSRQAEQAAYRLQENGLKAYALGGELLQRAGRAASRAGLFATEQD